MIDLGPVFLQAGKCWLTESNMNLPYLTSLDSAQQKSAGIETAQPMAMADRVRFSELDALNHVNNAVYMEWFERVRTHYLAERRLLIKGSPDNPRIVIRSGNIHYRQEMRQDEDYITTCKCIAYRTTSFTLRQQLWSAGELRASLDAVLVVLSPDGSRRLALSDVTKKQFQDLDGALETVPQAEGEV